MLNGHSKVVHISYTLFQICVLLGDTQRLMLWLLFEPFLLAED